MIESRAWDLDTTLRELLVLQPSIAALPSRWGFKVENRGMLSTLARTKTRLPRFPGRLLELSLFQAVVEKRIAKSLRVRSDFS